MKNQIKQILDNKWFIPLILLNFGLFYILYGEKYPATNGFGTDGFVYKTFVVSLNESFYFDSFFIRRIFPSFLIRLVLDFMTLELSPVNIFYSFELLNLLCLFISSLFIKKIFIFFDVDLKKQLLGFILLFVSFALIKWPFYFPAMTDSVGFCLSILLLYFYLKDKPVGIVIVTLMLAFTWPMGYYQGIILLALPYKRLEFISHTQKWNVIIKGGSVLFYLLVFTVVILMNGSDTNIAFVPKIDQSLLAITVIFSSFLFWGFSFLFMNAKLFNIREFIASLKLGRLFLSVLVFVGVSFFISLLHLPESSVYKMSTILENPIVHSSVRPLLTHVSHFTFYGVAFCLMVIYWKRIANVISRNGWGLTIAIALNLYLFGIMPESRMLINLFPWIVIFLVVALKQVSFSNLFYAVVVTLGFAASRIWLVINYELDPVLGMLVDKNGSLDFPNQKFYMNMGPWMSEYAYYLQGIFMIVCFCVLFVCLFKVKKDLQNKFKVSPRFPLIKQNIDV